MITISDTTTPINRTMRSRHFYGTLLGRQPPRCAFDCLMRKAESDPSVYLCSYSPSPRSVKPR